MNDAWNPAQYERFRAERTQPFDDLFALVKPHAAMRVIDLGCGTGELTAVLATRLGDADVLGIDSSAAMLERALPRSRPGLAFRCEDIRAHRDYAGFDLVFSNAALQWVPEHESVMPTILDGMSSAARLAVHMPRNFDQPSHTIAAALALEPAFRERFTGPVEQPATLTAERYAEMLFAHGFECSDVFEKIYGHVLANTGEVVEWAKGTLLTAFVSKLAPDDAREFVDAYRERILERLGERAPFHFTYRRLFILATKR